MKKILLLFLGVILFMGCVSQPQNQNDEEDKNTTYKPDINNEMYGDSNYGMNENDNYENPSTTTNTITYCKVDMGEGLVQEYYFTENEVKLRTTMGNEWNEIILTPTQSCAKSSDVAEEYCYPMTQGEFEETREGWKVYAQQVGTCN